MADDTKRVVVPEVVDLTTEFDELPDKVRSTPYSPETAPYDPTRDRERARGRIALLLLALLAATILVTFLLLYLKTVDVPGAKELLAVLLAPLVGLVGAVTGFYYGGKMD